MIRKWTTVVLSLLLAVMLPLCAFADTQHTLAVIPGDALASEQAIAELLDVLAIRLTKGLKSGALTLMLDGTDIVTAGLKGDATGLYAYSDLISDDVLYITWDDAFALLTDVMKATLEAQGADAAALSELEQSMGEAKATVVAAAANGMQTAATATPEQSIAVVEEMFGDDPAMMAYVEGVVEKLTVEEGTFTDPQRDVAYQKHTLTLTAEDVLPVMESAYVRTVLRDALAAEAADVSEAEMNALIDEQIAQAKTVLENSDMRMSCITYSTDGGQTPVGMEMGMTMNVENVNEQGELVPFKMGMNMNYDRYTDESGVAHKADMNMAMNGETMMEARFDLHRGIDDVSKGMLGLLMDGEELVFTYRAENTQPDVREREVQMYLRSNATAVLEPAASDRPLIGFEIVTSQADPALLSGLEQADATNCVDVMKLSDEALQTLMNGVSMRAQNALYTALPKLPTSVLNLAMNLFMGGMQ